MRKLEKFIQEKKKKKGFTLVELLAVMVVLALIMVLVAPNVLESMNNSKKAALKTYAKKEIQAAKERWQTDALLSNNQTAQTGTLTKTYPIKAASNNIQPLAPDQTQYIGCVKLTGTYASPTYTIYLFDNVNKLYITGTTAAIDTTAVTSGSYASEAAVGGNNNCAGA